MANPFVKAWKYLMALFSSKVDEYADPKVQIQQAIEEAQRQHQALTQQAAQVIGNQRQLEMRLNRQLADIEKLQVNVRQALTLADQAAASGRCRQGHRVQQRRRGVRGAAGHRRAERRGPQGSARPGAAGRRAGQEGGRAERDDAAAEDRRAHQAAVSQLEQAKMQEQVSASLRSMSELAAPGNTPSLDEVRDKIERRYANAMGSAELAQNSVQGRMMEVQQASVQMAGHSRLEQIRASMRGDAAACGWHGRHRTGHAGDQPAADTGKPAVAITFVGNGSEFTRGSTRGLAHPGAAWSRHRRGVVGRAGRQAQRGGRSACQVDAQTAVGAAARAVLHGLDRVLGGGDGTAGVVEHPGVGAVHPRA